LKAGIQLVIEGMKVMVIEARLVETQLHVVVGIRIGGLARY
jgi:hypothetical protein